MEYTECYVAFLDILGFKEIINNDSCENIYNCFETLINFKMCNQVINKAEISSYESLKYKIMSDSIIIYIEAKIQDSFGALVDAVSALQRKLIFNDNPVILRGGISKGGIYSDGDIIFGPGLTNAYYVESELAIYPRVVCTGVLFEDGKQNSKYTYPIIEGPGLSLLEKDVDELYYVKHLQTWELDCNKALDRYESICLFCSNNLNKNISARVRDKYLWLKKKTEKAMEEYVHMSGERESIYRQRRSEQSEAEMLEFNRRLEVFAPFFNEKN